MHVYSHAKTVRRTLLGEQAQARAITVSAPVGAQAAPAERSAKEDSLLQLRRAFDESPATQSHVALQLALNRPKLAPTHADMRESEANQKKLASLSKKPNNTGLPDRLKARVEQLSGLALDDVRVHYNSAKPTAVQAHAYAQGSDIHLAPGQEQHLPHEAWHVVQQKQGRVKPTLQLKGIAINDDVGLEREADGMGQHAQAHGSQDTSAPPEQKLRDKPTLRSKGIPLHRISLNGRWVVQGKWIVSHDNPTPRQVAEDYVLQADEKIVNMTEPSTTTILPAAGTSLSMSVLSDKAETKVQSPAPNTTLSTSVGRKASKPLTGWQKKAKAKKLAKAQKARQETQKKVEITTDEKRKGSESTQEKSQKQQDFSTEDEMMAYLAGSLDYSLEDMKQYAGENTHLFAGFAKESKENLEEHLDEWGDIIIGLMHQSKHTSAPSGVRGGGGDWASKRVRGAAAELAKKGDETLFPGGKYTVHHKVSRHRLKDLYARMNKDEKSGPVANVLDSMSDSVGAKSRLKILLNMPGNLEVGPLDDYRAEHLGADFDPNPGTPRSKILGEVDSAITSGKPLDWNLLAQKLQAVKTLHEEKLLEEKAGGPLTAPLKTQWKQAKGGKFTRDAPDED
jgi:hypothetical protein